MAAGVAGGEGEGGLCLGVAGKYCLSGGADGFGGCSDASSLSVHGGPGGGVAGNLGAGLLGARVDPYFVRRSGRRCCRGWLRRRHSAVRGLKVLASVLASLFGTLSLSVGTMLRRRRRRRGRVRWRCQRHDEVCSGARMRHKLTSGGGSGREDEQDASNRRVNQLRRGVDHNISQSRSVSL